MSAHSLSPNNAIKPGSILVQKDACWLTASSHHLDRAIYPYGFKPNCLHAGFHHTYTQYTERCHQDILNTNEQGDIYQSSELHIFCVRSFNPYVWFQSHYQVVIVIWQISKPTIQYTVYMKQQRSPQCITTHQIALFKLKARCSIHYIKS